MGISITRRVATDAEIFEETEKFGIRGKMTVHHFGKEYLDRRTLSGVRRVTRRRLKIHNVKGAPHDRCDGRLQRVTALWVTIKQDGKPDSGFVSQIKLDSPHLHADWHNNELKARYEYVHATRYFDHAQERFEVRETRTDKKIGDFAEWREAVHCMRDTGLPILY